MRAVMIVVVDELGQDPAQVALAEGNQMVEALPADCSDPTFADRVRARRLNRRPQTLDSKACDASAEVGTPDPVPVMDQVSRLAVPGCGFDQLPPDPRGGRVGGHLEVEQLAPAMTDEEDDVEGLEGQGLDHEEVGGPDRLGMVGKEGAPALAGRSRMATPAIAADGAGADHDAEFEQLTADPLGAPERVLSRHGGDQLPNLGAQSRPAKMAVGAPAPVEPPSLAVPANDGLRPNQDEVRLPVEVEAPDQQLDEPIPGLEFRTRTGTERDLELVPQEQVLDEQVLPVAEESWQRREEKAD